MVQRIPLNVTCGKTHLPCINLFQLLGRDTWFFRHWKELAQIRPHMMKIFISWQTLYEWQFKLPLNFHPHQASMLCKYLICIQYAGIPHSRFEILYIVYLKFPYLGFKYIWNLWFPSMKHLLHLSKWHRMPTWCE